MKLWIGLVLGVALAVGVCGVVELWIEGRVS